MENMWMAETHNGEKEKTKTGARTQTIEKHGKELRNT